MPIDETDRKRRHALLHAHFKAENDNDGDAIMATFAPDAVMTYNGATFNDTERIRWGHDYMGVTGRPDGAFHDFETHVDTEHCTDDEIVVEGHVRAKHARDFNGYAPTQRWVELPFVSFYRFDEKGKLTSERIVMNLGPLQP